LHRGPATAQHAAQKTKAAAADPTAVTDNVPIRCASPPCYLEEIED
jgi:hypothetical protein